ncbi:MAG: hypothetical protein H6721_04100 [Sandaracinus sp.]|nr:hypothetical protein [Sandaracinus sp.]MCB9631306.1 hypothetical protein [Sandaracinus sp.]
MSRFLPLTCVLALSLSGCGGGWQSRVISQASFDHSCPEPQVHVLADNGDRMARAVRLDVCGRQRMYRDIGGSQVYLFQDVTELNGGESSPPPDTTP